MSQQSDRLLKELLADEPDGVPWGEAVSKIKEVCDVKENTAETYIRRSDQATKEITADGEKRVAAPSSSGETVLNEEDEVLKMEVGDQTSSKFGELTVLEDVGHPLVPEGHEKGYFRRTMGGQDSSLSSKTDVQVVTATMQDDDFSTLLIGKHGVGKDKLILHIAANTNRPVLRVTASSNEDLIELLIGHYSPSEDGDGFEFKKGLATIAVEFGYILVIDEFNMLDGKTQAQLNGLLEDADQAKLTIPETNEVIEPHDEFLFVGTMNPPEVGYGGTEKLNQATESRFYPVEVPPLDDSAERKVVESNTEWDEDEQTLHTLLRPDGGIISGIRALHDQGKVSTWVSTRDIIKIGRMADMIGDPKAATETVLLGMANPEDKDPIKAAINDAHW